MVPSSSLRRLESARAVNGRVDLRCGENERVVNRMCGRILHYRCRHVMLWRRAMLWGLAVVFGFWREEAKERERSLITCPSRRPPKCS